MLPMTIDRQSAQDDVPHAHQDAESDVTRSLLSLIRVLEGDDDAPDLLCCDELDMRLPVTVDGRRYLVTIGRLSPIDESPPTRLSPREREIATCMTRGLTNKQIASELSLRPCTVSTYVKRLFLKLNVNSRSQLVAALLTGRMRAELHVRL